MKKILLTLMAACAVFSFASAQETGFGFGVKAGVNISNQTLDDAAKYKAGFTGGIFADYRTCNWFAVSVDVLYSRQGSKIENSDIKLRTDYLNIPVLANFYLTRGMALKTGVQPGFLLAAKAKEGDVKVDAKNIYKTFDLSIPVGLSYDFKFGLILDARYNIGVRPRTQVTHATAYLLSRRAGDSDPFFFCTFCTASGSFRESRTLSFPANHFSRHGTDKRKNR